jgi:hypothetical protein
VVHGSDACVAWVHALLGWVELQSGLRGACQGAVLKALNAACLVHSWLPAECQGAGGYMPFAEAKHHLNKQVQGQEGLAVAKTSVQGFRGKLRGAGARQGARGRGRGRGTRRGPGGVDVGCTKRRGTAAQGMGTRWRDRVDADAKIPDWVNAAWVNCAQSANCASASGDGGGGMEGGGVGARLLPLAWLQMR